MRILHVMPNVSRAFGGPTESLVGYVRAAQAYGVDVHVAAPAVTAADRRWLDAEMPGAHLHAFARAGRHAWVVAPGLWMWLWQRGKCYDAIHVHGLFNPVSSLAARICVGRGNPVVMRPFGTLSRYTFSRQAALKRMYFHLLDRPALQAAGAVHFTTRAEQEEASRLPLDLRGRAHVVPPPWRGSAQAAALDAKAARPTVLYLSRLHPKKNVTGLVDAWHTVVEAHPEAHLWIAGDGAEAYVRALRDRVARLGLRGHVSFLGFVQGEEKARVLRQAWAFALPSHQENFGVAVLEAVAAGLPVVISREVQLASFIERHALGRVVERSPEVVAEALKAVLADEDQRACVAAAGPAAVTNTFGLERVGRQLVALYQSVASGTA